MSGAVHLSLGKITNGSDSEPGAYAGRAVACILRLGPHNQEKGLRVHAETPSVADERRP